MLDRLYKVFMPVARAVDKNGKCLAPMSETDSGDRDAARVFSASHSCMAVGLSSVGLAKNVSPKLRNIRSTRLRLTRAAGQE